MRWLHVGETFERPSPHAEGDAHLQAANRRKVKIGLSLSVLGSVCILLGLGSEKLGHLNLLGAILEWTGLAAFVGGRVFLHWIRRERDSLDKPEPGKSPSFWHWRKSG